MGRDKVFVEFEGEALLLRMLRRLAGPWAAVLVARGAPERKLPRLPAGVTTFADPEPGAGPLGALAGLAEALPPDCGRAFVCAVDLPHLDPRLPAILAAAAGTDAGPAAVVPEAGGRLQVLAALYDRRALETAAALFATGERRLHALLDALPVRIVSADELRQRGIDPASFANWNRPGDLPAPGRRRDRAQ